MITAVDTNVLLDILLDDDRAIMDDTLRRSTPPCRRSPPTSPTRRACAGSGTAEPAYRFNGLSPTS